VVQNALTSVICKTFVIFRQFISVRELQPVVPYSLLGTVCNKASVKVPLNSRGE
jgi:hypothetical protein